MEYLDRWSRSAYLAMLLFVSGHLGSWLFGNCGQPTRRGLYTACICIYRRFGAHYLHYSRFCIEEQKHGILPSRSRKVGKTTWIYK